MTRHSVGVVGQTLALKWLQEDDNWVKLDKQSYPRMAEILSSVTGLTFTPSNARGVVKTWNQTYAKDEQFEPIAPSDMGGYRQLKSESKPTPDIEALTQLVSELEARVERLEVRVKNTEAALRSVTLGSLAGSGRPNGPDRDSERDLDQTKGG